MTIIRGLASNRNIKLCIASRPWNVFEAAFGADQVSKLYLEDLNRRDIQAYVKSTLEERPDFQSARIKEPKIDNIAEEIVSKSQGVFLWVFLVVRSLVEGLQNRDRLVDLQARLRSFPSDLNEFFRHILLSVDNTYCHSAARAFSIALASFRPLPILQFWFADLDEADPNFLIKVPISSISQEELGLHGEDMRLRLNSRTKGLLEVTRDSEGRYCVDFLHRTVDDYLRSEDMQRMLGEWRAKGRDHKTGGEWRPPASHEAFDPHRSICNITVAAVRSQFRTTTSIGGVMCLLLPHDIETLLDDFFFSLKQYEAESGKTLGEAVTFLDQTLAEATAGKYTTKLDRPLFWALEYHLFILLQERLAKIHRVGAEDKGIWLITSLSGSPQHQRRGSIDPRVIELILERGPKVKLGERVFRNFMKYRDVKLADEDPNMSRYQVFLILLKHSVLTEFDSSPYMERFF